MRYCLRDPTFSRFDRTPASDGQTDGQMEGHRAIAFTALAQRRAVKIRLHRIGQFFTFLSEIRVLSASTCKLRILLEN